MFTIKYEEIKPENKARGFEQTMKQMINILGDLDKYYQGVAVLITKVALLSDEKEVLSFFEQILKEIPVMSQNPVYKKFLTYIIGKKIPLLLIYEPELPQKQKIVKDAAIPVTDQYTNVIRQTYDTVSKKLTPVSFIKLNAPAIGDM